jgi:prophage regulatory protein
VTKEGGHLHHANKHHGEPMQTNTQTHFDDLPDVALIQLRPLLNYKVLPYSATTIWRKCRSNEFPQPIKVSKGVTAWVVSDVRKYLQDISQRNVDTSKPLQRALASEAKINKPVLPPPSKASQSRSLQLLANELGLAGHEIHKLQDGFLVCQANYVKFCANYEELVILAKTIGALK